MSLAAILFVIGVGYLIIRVFVYLSPPFTTWMDSIVFGNEEKPYAPPKVFSEKMFALLRDLVNALPAKKKEILLQELSDLMGECEEIISRGEIAKTLVILSYIFGVVFSILLWTVDEIKKKGGFIPKQN